MSAMEEVNLTEAAVRGLMRVTLLHVSNLHGGSCVVCAEAAAFLKRRPLSEVEAAFSSSALQVRLFWHNFSILRVDVQEKILNCARISLELEGARPIWRDEIDAFVNSARGDKAVAQAVALLARPVHKPARAGVYTLLAGAFVVAFGATFFARQLNLISARNFNVSSFCALAGAFLVVFRYVMVTLRAGLPTVAAAPCASPAAAREEEAQSANDEGRADGRLRFFIITPDDVVDQMRGAQMRHADAGGEAGEQTHEEEWPDVIGEG